MENGATLPARPHQLKLGFIWNGLIEVADPYEFAAPRNVLALDNDIAIVVLERFNFHAQSLNGTATGDDRTSQ